MSIQSQFTNLPNILYSTLYTGENTSTIDITNYFQDKFALFNKKDNDFICYTSENQTANNFGESNEVNKIEFSENNHLIEDVIAQTNFQDESINSNVQTGAIFHVTQPFPSMQDVHNVPTSPQLPFQFNDSTCLIGYSQPLNTDDLIVSMNSPMQIFQGVTEYPHTIDTKDVSLPMNSSLQLVPNLINYPQTTTGLVSVASDPSLQFVPGMLNYFQPVISEDPSLQINPQMHIVQGLINYTQPIQNNEVPSTYDPSIQIYQGNIIQQPCNSDYGNILLDQYKTNCIAIQPVYSNPTIQHVFLS